jgi:protein SCO1/2
LLRSTVSILLLSFLLLSHSTLYAQPSRTPKIIGIDEQLGSTLPLELTFINEKNESVQLKDLIHKPTIFTLVYYRCPTICKPLLSGVAQVLESVDMEPGVDYNVVTISFDETDTPADSENMRKNFVPGFPEKSWVFLTGDTTNIRKITNAVGFRYVRTGMEFNHPAVLMVLTAEGKLARYLYGMTYMPFDIKMAINEASLGKVTPTIARVLLFCFSYDPEGRRYVANVTRIVGIIILLTALVFFVVLMVIKKVKKAP